MVERKLEPEVISAFALINNGKNFLLSGGAGSGKTYSLVEVIQKYLKDFPTHNIACMTYTNAAVKEIRDRVTHPNLMVATIHDFLWDSMKFYRKELKNALIELINEPYPKIIFSDRPVPADFFDQIPGGLSYMEHARIKDGIISHDEVIYLAENMFRNYPKLCDILKDRFKLILIDEYQDTHPLVVKTFLTHLSQGTRKNILGFFGDTMQAIFPDAVGDLNEYLEDDKIQEVQKMQNRRNPELIMLLANRLRKDGIIQEASLDETAPNMLNGKVKQGDLKFMYSVDKDLDTVKAMIGWDFTDVKETKELHLTHNLIAKNAGYPTLMGIYDKDPIIGLKYDILKKIKENVEKGLPAVLIGEDDTFNDVVDRFALRARKKAGELQGQLKKDIILLDPKNKIYYNLLKDLRFEEVRKIFLTKDSLIDDKQPDPKSKTAKGSKRDYLINQLFKIQQCVNLYELKRYNEFLRLSGFSITKADDKLHLKNAVETIKKMSSSCISDVIDYAGQVGLCPKGDKFLNFIQQNQYLYTRVGEVSYDEFLKLYDFIEGKTPFSTQHKVKGAQFDNVLVVMDNGRWNDYNFEYLFEEKGNTTVLERTQKIFYVCCTRAKERLVVFYKNPTPQTIAKAKDWFGISNVVQI